MDYTIEPVQDVLLIKLNGDLWGTLEAYQLKDEITAQLEKGARKYLMDLSEVASVNSVGIGIIVSAMVSIKRVEGELKLTGVSDRAKIVMGVTGVWELLDVYENRNEAFESFSTTTGGS